MDVNGFFGSLDLQTLWFALGISALMQASVLALLSLMLTKYQAGKTAMVGSILVATGLLLVAFQGQWPDFITVVVANTVVVCGPVMYYVAVCQFTNHPVKWIFVGLVMAGVVVGLAYLTYVAPSVTARIVVVSVAIMVLFFALARVLITASRPEYAGAARLLVVLFILLGLALLTRAVYAVIWPEEAAPSSSSVQTLIIIIAMVVSYLALGGAMIMFGQRLRYDMETLATQLELRVAQRTAELAAANRELESLVYTIAHDLRAPARAMSGFSQLLEEHSSERLDGESQHYLHQLQQGAQRMGQMVDGLLAFMRLGRQPIRKQTVDVAALVQDVMVELQSETDRQPVSLTIAELPACDAEIGLLRQVFTHLLSNALKYTRGRNPARVEIGWQDGAYFVRDNGIGFDMRYASKLFGVFQRLNRAEDFEGTGVGLAISRRIVERHGGRIWAEAEPDKGATFYFTLAPGR